MPAQELLHAPAGEASASVQARCTAARLRAVERQGTLNQALQGQQIDAHVLLAPAAVNFVQAAAAKLGWSARGIHRTLKVARAIADLAGSVETDTGHVAEAVQYRRALLGGAG
jgi:magnesium chelatase family protein